MKKIRKHRQFIYKSCVKNSDFFHAPVNLENSDTGQKSFCFSAKPNQRYTKASQRSCLAQTLIKTPKNNYYRGNNV